MSKPTIIFDLDGTIVKCGRYYNASAAEIAERMTSIYGISKEFGVELIEWLDVWAIRAVAKDGFKRERYPRASAAAMAVAGAIVDGEVHPEHISNAYQRANQVFEQHEPFDGAIRTIERYVEDGWQVLILSKGDEAVQNAKLERTGLVKIVHAWQVVPKKNAEVLAAFCRQFSVDVGGSYYVGDSIRDDIGPAKEVGLTAVRIRQMPEDEWVFDSTPDLLSDHTLNGVADLPTIIPLSLADSQGVA